MTPKSKEELRKQIVAIIEDEITDDAPDYWPDIGPWADRIMRSFALYRQQELERALREARVDENLACSQIMTTYWKTSEMLTAASKRRAELQSTINEDRS